jgi:polysaccharide pyruvyl transferase WcaK-like protein
VEFQEATQVFILLLPFQKSEDLDIATAIQSQLPGGSHILFLEDPRQLKGVFRGVEMSIGMRLHSLIMAGVAGCRCFALSCDPKVNRLMEDLAIPGWDVANLPDDPSLISRTWVEYYLHSHSLPPEKIESLVNQALIHREFLGEVLL